MSQWDNMSRFFRQGHLAWMKKEGRQGWLEPSCRSSPRGSLNWSREQGIWMLFIFLEVPHVILTQLVERK